MFKDNASKASWRVAQVKGVNKSIYTNCRGSVSLPPAVNADNAANLIQQNQSNNGITNEQKINAVSKSAYQILNNPSIVSDTGFCWGLKQVILCTNATKMKNPNGNFLTIQQACNKLASCANNPLKHNPTGVAPSLIDNTPPFNYFLQNKSWHPSTKNIS